MRFMNVAVVIPPIEDFYFSHRRFASLGAVKGAEILKKAGFTTDIFDFTKGSQYRIELPQPIKYLNKYIMEEEKGSCSFFTSYTHFGYDTDKCASIIASGNYIAVFVSLFAYCYADSAIAFAKSLKRIKPDIKIIACGAGVSVFPEYFKEYFDSVITGEAEIFLEWYTNARSSLAEDIASCTSYTSLSSRDFILPKYHLPIGDFKERHTKTGDFTPSIGIAYTDKKNLCVSFMLSRGCFKNCRFCSNFITHGRGFRNTEPEMLKETLTNMKPVFAEHKNKKIFINIEDDNILCDKPAFLKQLEIIKEFFINNGFSDLFFSAENGLDYMLLDEDICNTLIKNYNFRQFNFTMTSSDKNVTESQKRDSDLNKLESILYYLGENKSPAVPAIPAVPTVPSVPAVTYFIAGLDSDSPEKSVDSLLFLSKTPGLSGISMFYAVPGLLGFNSDQFISSELCRGSSAFPWNNTLSTKQLITAFRISRTINFLKKGEDQLQNNEQELRRKIISEKKLFTLTVDNSIVEPKQVDSEMVEMFFEKYHP